MPFCTNCGSEVGAQAAFCSNCGTRQYVGPAPSFLSGINDRTASILCYLPVVGIIADVIFLTAEQFRFNYRVRFDAFQSLYLFLAWLILTSAAPVLWFSDLPGHSVFGLLKLALVICWLYLLIKAANSQQVRLPIIGDLAVRSTHEQR